MSSHPKRLESRTARLLKLISERNVHRTAYAKIRIRTPLDDKRLLKVSNLRKRFYVLYDAARTSHDTMKAEFEAMCSSQLDTVRCIFTTNYIIVIFYVDDLFIFAKEIPHLTSWNWNWITGS